MGETEPGDIFAEKYFRLTPVYDPTELIRGVSPECSGETLEVLCGLMSKSVKAHLLFEQLAEAITTRGEADPKKAEQMHLLYDAVREESERLLGSEELPGGQTPAEYFFDAGWKESRRLVQARGGNIDAALLSVEPWDDEKDEESAA